MTSTKHATLRYTALRLGVFVGCLVGVALLAYLGVIPAGVGTSHPLWLVLLALILSAPLSLVLLRGQRDAMSEQLASGVDRARRKLEESRRQEDEPSDAAPRGRSLADG